MQGRRIANHSGRVTCCTRLYNDGFEEQSVAGHSGHRSNAIQLYKRPCLEPEKAESFALAVPKSVTPTNRQSVKSNSEVLLL